MGGDALIFDHEDDALSVLDAGGYKQFAGLIYHPEDKDETPEETAAINYLCSEWDYGTASRAEIEYAKSGRIDVV